MGELIYWSRENEQLLFQSIIEASRPDHTINWSAVKAQFPNLTYDAIYSKYYRMKQNKKIWNFKREIRKKYELGTELVKLYAKIKDL